MSDVVVKHNLVGNDWKDALLARYSSERDFEDAIDDAVDDWKKSFFSKALYPAFDHPYLQILKEIPPGSFGVVVEEVRKEATKILTEYRRSHPLRQPEQAR